MGSEGRSGFELVDGTGIWFQIVRCKWVDSVNGGGAAEGPGKQILTEEPIEFSFLTHETDPHTFIPLCCWKTGRFGDLSYIRFGEFAKWKEGSF